MPAYVTLKYDLLEAIRPWIAVSDAYPSLTGHGDSPEDAVRSLAAQVCKHDLWDRVSE